MKNFKKFFAVFLALCMVMGFMSITAYADLGDYAEPYELYAGNPRPTGVFVPAGETKYVKADDCNGTVVSAMGYLSSDVETPVSTYQFSYGRMPVFANADGTGTLELATMGGDIFGIYNPGEEDITVYVTLGAAGSGNTAGTMDDPEEIVLAEGWRGIMGMAETTLEAGNEGYFYFVTAPADGLLSVSIDAMDEEYNPVGWMYNVDNATQGKYGDIHRSDDEEPVYYEELKVSEGDIINVFASTYNPEDEWSNPAGTVVVNVMFSPVGSYGCPDVAEDGEADYTLEENSQGYYVKWTATKKGSAIISVSGEKGWQFFVNGVMADETYYYGDTHSSTDEVVVDTESVPVAPGDVLTIFVNTALDEETWICPAGTVTVNIDFIAAEEEAEVTVSEEVLNKITEGSEVVGLEENKSIILSPVYGHIAVAIKDLEASTLKDKLYTAMDMTLAVYNADWDFYTYPEFAEGEKADVTLAIGEVFKDAEDVEVYMLGADGKLTLLSACEVKEGKIAFSVNTVGTYVFVDATVVEEDVPPTGDTTPMVALIALATVAGAAVVLTKKKAVQE